MEIASSSVQRASKCPSVSHDTQRQHGWCLVGEDISEYLKQKDDASWAGLMTILDTHARKGHCAAGIGYPGVELDDGMVLLSQEKDADTKRGIGVPEAGRYL